MTVEEVLTIEHECIANLEIWMYMDDPNKCAALLFNIEGINTMADCLINELKNEENE